MNIRNRLIILLILIFSSFMLDSFYVWPSDEYIDLLFPDIRPTGYVTMNFKDAPLKVVLKVFSEQTGLNIIASQDIEDKGVTLYLDNVPVDDVLDNIFKAYNLTYEQEKDSNIIIVKQAIRIITRVYYLKFARVSGSALTQEITKGVGSSSGMSGLLDAIRNILSPEGKVIEDSRTNSVVISDIPSRFPLIEETIRHLDVSTPQVMIEVEMLDTSKDSIDKLGLKFGGPFLNVTGSSRKTFFPFPERLWDAAVETGNVAKWATGSTTGGFTMGTMSAVNFSLVLEFLTTDSDTKYLARPRLLTLSNETAEIKITTDEAIGKKSSTSGEAGTTTLTEEAERAETGVSLRVTPQVNLDTGDITMFIQPAVKEAKLSDITIGNQTVKDPETRESHTMVRIRDGETVVVAGLIRNKGSDAKTKVPFLSEIPILGAAFRHRERQSKDRELVVFITPHIIKESMPTNSFTKTSEGVKIIPQREQDISSIRHQEIDDTLDRYDKIR